MATILRRSQRQRHAFLHQNRNKLLVYVTIAISVVGLILDQCDRDQPRQLEVNQTINIYIGQPK